MDRREFLSSVCMTAAAAALTGFAGNVFSKPPQMPNIIFILADDLGWGDIGCYGNPHIRTPNLDSLAAGGTRFTQFYVCGSVCSPTRASVLTGDFPAKHSIHGHLASSQDNAKRGMPDSLSPDLQTLPALLKNAGYKTGHFGKWHLGVEDASKYGYDEAKTTNGGGKNGYPLPQGYQTMRNGSTKIFTDDAIDFIERHKREPFFVNLWYLDPHATLEPTDEMLEEYKRFRVCEKFAGTQQIYYSVVTEMDKHIGRVLSKLDELGLAENTIVMFSSDNGPEDLYINNASHSAAGWPGPFRGRKRSLYEGGVRVPFILRRPGKVAAGDVDNDTVMCSVDLLPSLCRLAGINRINSVDGDDLSAVFEGRKTVRKKTLYWEYRFTISGYQYNRSPFLAIREGNWKLLANADKSRVELYDIPNDPMELNNIAAQNRPLADRLLNKLLNWHNSLPKGEYSADAGANAYDWPQPIK